MDDTEQYGIETKYLWLVSHLIWNGSKKTNGTYWVKITKDEAFVLEKKYEVCDTRPMKGGVRLNVIKMCDNFIVLDIR